MLATVLVNAVALWLGSEILRGVEVGDFVRALVIGAALGLLNWALGGLLDTLTAPLRWITFGFFALIVDAIVLMVASYFLKGLKIESFWWALAMAVLISLVSTAAENYFLKKKLV